jgi:putative oxidoreductase
MLRKLMQTNDDVPTAILRFLLGVVFFPHGMRKVPGWFGGGGFEATMEVLKKWVSRWYPSVRCIVRND